MIRYRNNTNICVRKEISYFVGITILIKHMTWIRMKQVQEIQIRFWFGVYLDEWFWGYGNVYLWYLGLFPAPYYQILITNLLIKAWRHVCSQLDSLERYFTKVGCGMSATGHFPVIIYLFMLLMTIKVLFRSTSWSLSVGFSVYFLGRSSTL